MSENLQSGSRGNSVLLPDFLYHLPSKCYTKGKQAKQKGDAPMKLLFKQRLFSWFDSYDIYDEAGNTVLVVKGELSWGHLLRVYNARGDELGVIKQKVLTWLPKFEIYRGDQYIGCISREFTLLRPKYNIDYNGWQVEGNWLEWDYTILDASGRSVASVSKELWNWTDTYSIDVRDPQDALSAVMLVLAIDAEKCSRNQ
jgi:uncharacterized protein YxjI